jgi:hypothetical protein
MFKDQTESEVGNKLTKLALTERNSSTKKMADLIPIKEPFEFADDELRRVPPYRCCPMGLPPAHFGKPQRPRNDCLIQALNHLIKIKYFWSPL